MDLTVKTEISMNDKDKEAFEKWYDLPADQTLNEPKLYRQFLEDTLPDHTKTFCEKAWQAACEYKELEINAHVNHLVDWDDEIGRLKKEVGDLKQKLEAAEKIKSR
jgi:hypothetical protein